MVEGTSTQAKVGDTCDVKCFHECDPYDYVNAQDDRSLSGGCGSSGAAPTAEAPILGDGKHSVRLDRTPDDSGSSGAALVAAGPITGGENGETGEESDGELVDAEWDDRGMCERDLKEEAVSMAHLMCHYAKDSFCKACQRA